MDLRLIARDGVFSTADAARHGLDKNALRRLEAQGCCVRLTTGWFAVLSGPAPAPEDLHRLRARALGRQLRHRAALSHHSRVLMGHLPTFGVDLSTVHLTSVVDPIRQRADGSVRRRSVTVRRPGVVVHRPLEGFRAGPGTDGPTEGATDDPTAVRSLPMAYALVQLGLLAGPESFLVSADAAVSRRLADQAGLSRAVARLGGHEGIGPVRAVLSQVDGRHESPGESRAAYLMTALGFVVEPQFEVRAAGRAYRPDFRLVGTRVLVEFDGAVKYGDDRRVLFDEKRREDDLRRDGWVVVRLTWADLANPDLVRRRIDAAVALAA